MRPLSSFVGQPIRSLQTMLRVIAEDDPTHLRIVPDGIYGPETAAAVSTFQRKHGLPVTGVTDHATWEAVVGEYTPALVRIDAAHPVDIIMNPGQVIRRGESNPHLYLAQAMLTVLADIYKSVAEPTHSGILDEPTAVLTTQETVELFKELRHLKEQGYTIVFISHKLNEIMEITDRLTIMRGGRSMGVYNTCDVTKEEISRLMVGRDVILNVQKDKANPSDVVLRVRDVEYVNEWHKKMLDKISFDVRRGEILGVAGVEGNGQKELVDMLFGFLTPNAGSVTLGSESILGLSQQKLRDRGVALIPEDRMLYGIAGSASIEENLISDRSAEKRLNHGPLFNMKAIHDEADKLIEDYAVLCKSRKQQVGMLSGGNIQKVVVAREFSGNPVLILADQPTRGIDVGATEFIRKKLVELSRSGIAVLLISADLAEVMELSDSLIVMHGGKIAAYFEDTSTLTDDVMGEYMLGLKTQSEEEIRRVCHD